MPDETEVDEIFTLLSNVRRRAVLSILDDHEKIGKGELATRVAELQYNTPADQLNPEKRHTVYVSLQQTHLDALEEASVIYRDEGDVMKGERFGDVFRIIEPNKSLTGRIKRSLTELSV